MSSFLREITTASGPIVGHVFGALQVMGVSRRLTETGNQTSASTFFSEKLRVEIPVGTQLIIPCIEKWVLGFGSDQKDNPNEMKWLQAQHPFGLGNVAVRVLEIEKPNRSNDPPQQHAQIGIFLCLADESVSQPWFGKVHYHLIHLGGMPSPDALNDDFA